MIRWAMSGLVVLLSGASGFAQTADVIHEVSGPPLILRPNPFGGAPVQVVGQLKAVPMQGLPNTPILRGPGDGATPPPSGPRPARPVYTLPGPPKLDQHGDPLPAGAVARYGTVRLRHGAEVQAMVFSHDAKLLCTVSGTESSIRLWDTATGKEVARLTTPAQLVGLTKDGAVIVDQTRVRVWLRLTNRLRDLPEKTLPEGASPSAIAVNPDGRSFAIATSGKVLLIDLLTGKTLKELNLPGARPPANAGGDGPPPPVPVKLLYSPDGRFLAGNGQDTGVWLWDLRTGKRVRTYRSELEFPEYAFSPDVTKIVVTGENLALYALDSEENIEGFNGPEGDAIFAPRYSTDGKTLFVVNEDGGVIPLDAATGEGKEGPGAHVMNLRPPFALAPGAVRAAGIDQSGGIRIWDPKTGKGPELPRLPPLLDIGIAVGGKSVTVLDQTNKLHTFDLATGVPGKATQLPVEEDGLPATWDAIFRRAALLDTSGEELEVHIFDADARKVVSKHPFPQNAGIPFVAFAAGNRDRMAMFGLTVVIVNPTTGKTVRSFNPGPVENTLRGAISPDGRLVAVATRPLCIWEVATGKKRLSLDAIPNADLVMFSADARVLAVADLGGHVTVVDVRTGTTIRRFQAADEEGEGFTALAISPDGKRLALGSPLGRVTVWDVATGDVLAPFAGHDGIVRGLVFTADGKKLVSSSQDGTALVWAVPDKPRPAGPVETAVAGFDEAFRLLGSADAAQAQRGLDYLYRHPAEAVKQTAARMPAPVATSAAKLVEYVADLESDDFPTRDAAVKALAKVGGEASALLKHAVEKSSSAEVRKLAAELLGKIEAPVMRPEDLKMLRTVEMLENLGIPEARAQLEKWAAGPAGHRLTLEATAAVARLRANSGK